MPAMDRFTTTYTPNWYTPCDKCGAVTAWLRCVMCGGTFDYHCPQGKYYKKVNK